MGVVEEFFTHMLGAVGISTRVFVSVLDEKATLGIGYLTELGDFFRTLAVLDFFYVRLAVVCAALDELWIRTTFVVFFEWLDVALAA